MIHIIYILTKKKHFLTPVYVLAAFYQLVSQGRKGAAEKFRSSSGPGQTSAFICVATGKRAVGCGYNTHRTENYKAF